MKAAIYCRVSTDNQEREGTSLGSQLEACLSKAHELGYEMPQELIFKETYSGLTLDRPILSQVRELIRNQEIDGLIAYTLDRVSRDPVHFIILQGELEKAGVEIILVTETIDSSDLGKLITYIKGYAAKLEAEKIKERTMRGRKARALAGKLPGGSNTKLYGYNYLPGRGIGEGVRYINEEEAEWVRRIFKWYAEEELSLTKVANRLNSLGVINPSGTNRWARTTIYGILKQPAYIGQDLQVPNSTPLIIAKELFDSVQLMLRSRKQLSPRRMKREYLLRGHISCAQCGRHYIGQARVMGSKVYQYYFCLRAYNGDTPPKCHNRNWRVEELDALVWAEVEKVLTNPEVVFTELQKGTEESQGDMWVKELKRVQRLIKNREAQKERTYKAFYLTGDEETFKHDIAMVEQDIKRLGAEASDLEHQIELSNKYQLDISRLKEACALVASNIKALSFDEKRLALQALHISVMIDGDKVTLSGAVPTRGLSSVSSQAKLTI
jgi:site-specific DNA recombinase